MEAVNTAVLPRGLLQIHRVCVRRKKTLAPDSLYHQQRLPSSRHKYAHSLKKNVIPRQTRPRSSAKKPTQTFRMVPSGITLLQDAVVTHWPLVRRTAATALILLEEILRWYTCSIPACMISTILDNGININKRCQQQIAAAYQMHGAKQEQNGKHNGTQNTYTRAFRDLKRRPVKHKEIKLSAQPPKFLHIYDVDQD